MFMAGGRGMQGPAMYGARGEIVNFRIGRNAMLDSQIGVGIFDAFGRKSNKQEAL